MTTLDWVLLGLGIALTIATVVIPGVLSAWEMARESDEATRLRRVEMDRLFEERDPPDQE